MDMHMYVLHSLAPNAVLKLWGQELNVKTFLQTIINEQRRRKGYLDPVPKKLLPLISG